MNLRITIAVLALCVSSGCATITQGTSQSIKIENLPEEVCALNEQEISPQENQVIVKKGSKDLKIQCQKVSKAVKSSVSRAGVVGAILLDGGLIDMYTGAMWEYPSVLDFLELPDFEEE